MAWARRGWLHGAPVVLAWLLLVPSARAGAGASRSKVPQRSAPEQGGTEQGGTEQGGTEQGGTEQGGWLSWQGPIECQNTREVERQLESLLGYAPERQLLPPTRVEVGWGSARGWSLLIRVSLPQGERRREVVVRTCADGFDVVALTLALILDPELGMDAGLDAEPLSDPSEPDPAGAEPAASSATAVSALPAELPAPAAEPPQAMDVAGEAPLPVADGRPALRLSGGGRADLGTLPATLFGGGLSLSLSAWHWRLDGGAAYLGRGTQSLPLAVNQVSYSNAFGLLRGCRELSPRGGGRFDVCLGGQLGSLSVKELGGAARSGRGLWAAATLGAELGLELGEAWGAYSGVELVFPLARHELGLASGAVVYELPAISVQLNVGLVLRLTESAAP